jgi:iron complex transport system substrate-binding protein
MRIVSLLPAATEIVCALGLRDSLVGRSHECDYPLDVASLPALTSARLDSTQSSLAIDEEVRRVLAEGLPLYALAEEQLAALAPDVVVTQAACEVCAISLEQVASVTAQAAPEARVISLSPAFLGDILADVRTVAEACGVVGRGKALEAALADRLRALGARGPAHRPRVAVIEWLAPPMLAGHWVPETIEAAGGVPLGPRPGEGSVYLTWDAIAALRPDAVVVAPCGFDLARTIAESRPHAERLRSLAPRVLLLDGNAYLNRPGPRIVEAAEILAAWLRDGHISATAGASLGAFTEPRSS